MLTAETLRLVKRGQVNRLNAVVTRLERVAQHKIQHASIRIGNKKCTNDDVDKLRLGNMKGVYLVFVSKNDVDNLKDTLDDYRKKQENGPKKQALPRPNKTNSAKDGCIYVGMISKGTLNRRFKEHFIGTASPKTSALKLPLWAKHLKKVDLQFIVFDKADCDLIPEYEKALWLYYEPALGEL